MAEKEVPKFGTGREKVLTPKQIRARARRAQKRIQEGKKPKESGRLSPAEVDILARKPIEDWDMEELARGRPRDSAGGFKGKTPDWITREYHEQIMTRFKDLVKQDMRALTPSAVGVLQNILNDDEEDDRGRPKTPPSVKLQAATLLLEHLVGKPTQRVEGEVSVKLQALLAAVVVQPGEDDRIIPASSHSSRVIEAEVEDDDE